MQTKDDSTFITRCVHCNPHKLRAFPPCLVACRSQLYGALLVSWLRTALGLGFSSLFRAGHDMNSERT